MRPRAGPGMAGAGSNWLSGVNVVLVMAYGSLVSTGGTGRDGLAAWSVRGAAARVVRGAPARLILARPWSCRGPGPEGAKRLP